MTPLQLLPFTKPVSEMICDDQHWPQEFGEFLPEPEVAVIIKETDPHVVFGQIRDVRNVSHLRRIALRSQA